MKNQATTPHFDSLLAPGKIWYNTKEAAELLGRSTQFIRDCCDTGRLHGHRLTSYNASGKERHAYQFHRDALQLFLLETATYQTDDFVDRLAALLKERSVEETKAIFRRAGVLLAVSAPDLRASGRASPPPPPERLRATGTC
ncbi:helix-turn-helix domain-containing protein [Cerasicoccus maritimus]|uniref:helix-turn-helix domain-containing protein n=1 Tax=Cerasicoccus maritimus TaxID=490089 RepID=UPI002852D949|nr:helix-turn-helix domain-containing protein [Cerasicoccus maritimus]